MTAALKMHIEDPKTYKQAMASEHAAEWREAIQTEINNLRDKDAIEVVRRDQLPRGTNVCKSRMLFKVKWKRGELDKFKARFVCCGFSQRKGLDWFENFASVARIESARVLIALCAGKNLTLKMVDFVAAFLQAKMDTDVYIDLPPGMARRDSHNNQLVGKLKKALYGSKQAGRLWSIKLAKWLVKQGFKQSEADRCVYVKTFNDGTIVIITTYVDDCLGAHTTSDAGRAHYADFMRDLKDNFDVKDMGIASTYLGININHHEDGSIMIEQSDSIQKAGELYDVQQRKPFATPMLESLTLSKADSSSSPEDCEFMRGKNYKEIVGKLLYFAVMTRPDVATAVSMLARFMDKPGPKMYTAALRVMNYLYHTRETGITYHPGNNLLITSSDADLSANKDTRRSRTGLVIMLNGAAVCWKSRLQPSVALSSTEAEYYSAAVGCCETMFLRQILEDMHAKQMKPTPVLEDNQGCIGIANSTSSHSKAKHIDRRWHFVRDAGQDGIVEFVYCPTDKQPSDIMTKSLGGVKFAKFRDHIMGIKSIDFQRALYASGGVETDCLYPATRRNSCDDGPRSCTAFYACS